MADELKRVGLVFKADGSTDFRKILQEVNVELNKNYNQFKLVQSQWDNSTKSVEKLRAEQEYLKNAYEIQGDKVATLRMQLDELENAENKNTTAIKKKQNELTNAEIKLETYGKRIKEIDNELKNSGKAIEEWGKKVESAGKNIENAGKKVSAFSAASATALIASAKSAIDFESAFTGVEKTVDGTEEQMKELKQGIRDMAKEIPSTTTEISAVAEAAGQLGIKTEDILSFTKVMIDLGNSTNLSAEEAASSLAKFANITKMSADDYDKLGSTVVALGNNFATTEADIVAMATRLAATGELAGLSEPQILSLATAMSSVGIEAEAGGSAMSKLLKRIQIAVETGSKDLKDFADVAGMSSKDFKKAFEEDAVKALTLFIRGLNDTERNGKSAIAILDDMEINEVRMSNAVLSLANASDLLSDAVDLGNKAWEDNTALTNEANKRYDTLKSKITIALNKLKDMAITIGNKLMPSIEKIIDIFEKWIKKFEGLSDKQVDIIVKIGLIVAAIGPLITIVGKLISIFGKATQGIGTVVQAIGVMKGTTTTASTAAQGLATILGTIASPAGLAATAITGLTAAVLGYAISQHNEMTSLNGVTKSLEGQKKSWQDLAIAREEMLKNNSTEITNIQTLVDELDKIVDENGKIKAGYENRANYIVNELNGALGTEYKINGDIIEQYKTMQEDIQKLISQKKAEALLNAYQTEYAEALKQQSKATENLIDLRRQLVDAEKELSSATNGRDRFEAEEKIQVITEKIKEQVSMIDQYGYTIKNYENLQTASVSNSAEAIENAVTQMGISWDKAREQTEQSIAEQVNSQAIYVQNLKEALDTAKLSNDEYQQYILNSQLETAQKQLDNLIQSMTDQTSTIETMSEDEITAWKTLADTNYLKYVEYLDKLPPETASKIREMTDTVYQNTPMLVDSTAKMSNQILDQIEKNPEFKKEALNNLQGLLDGMEDSQLRELLKASGFENIDDIIQAIKDGNLAEDQGMQILKNMNTGLNNKSWKSTLFDTARNIASSLSGLLTVKANVNGTLSKLPGHKSGLDYVPKDNYIARLHKGERVLTKEENEEYTEAEKENKTRSYSSSVLKKNKEVESNQENIDYDKLFKIFLKALNSCKIELDKDGFIKFIDNRLLEVM